MIKNGLYKKFHDFFINVLTRIDTSPEGVYTTMGDRLDDVAAKLAQLHDETFVAMQRSAECRARLNLLSVGGSRWW